MKLYEYAVIYNPLPTKDQSDRGEVPKSVLIVDVKRVLANNEKEALMLAARDIPETHTAFLDRVEIACRPF
jgi:hypothetical protein